MRWRALPVVALLLAGCSPGVTPSEAPQAGGSAPAVLADVGPLVQGMTQRTPKELPTARLADGLTPPTNRWYSGLVFGDKPNPVFPLPLSFGLTGDGFAFGLPKVTASKDTIAGGFAPDVSVGLGAARSVVSNSDPSVVVLDNLAADGALLGRTTIAQGSPFVSFVAAADTTVTVPAGFAPAGKDLAVATIGGTRYALAGSGLDGGRVKVAAGSAIRFWPVPEGHDPAELAGRSAPLTGSTLSYQPDGDGVRTALSYATTGGETAIARMPHQGAGAGCDLGSYPSIYGTMTLCAGSSLTWTTPRTAAGDHLDLKGLSPANVRRLTRQLDADIAAQPAFPADTYFGGKALQRTAMLLSTADQLGLKDRADRLAKLLDQQLTSWTEPKGCDQRADKCFVYDPKGKGLIGQASSFGSEEYNDHHFHYGYFLYAAAVMAAHDPGVVDRYSPVMNLVASDIASSGSTAFPDRRAFDAYAGHSWASGTAPFADGNNQESVSEAINAYAGLALWARVVKNDALTREADWMLSLEVQSSRSYWLEPDLSGFAGYRHRITVLNWGAKRDYGTWFSPAPAAKLGILLLPMSPTSTYLTGSPKVIRANVSAAVGKRFNQKFGDYILMYSALAGPADRRRALAAEKKLSDKSLDDGMSRTYLLAWLLSIKP